MMIAVYVILLFVLVLLEVWYIRLANKYNIRDKPNYRSSHTTDTIRGGGIIFPISVFIWGILSSFPHPFFLLGLVILTVISFLDDLYRLKTAMKSFFQLIGVCVLLLEFGVVIPTYLYPVIIFLIMGILNAYNFMDGINGITASYSLVTLATFLYVNLFKVHFISDQLLIFVISSLLIFGFFNFRKNAVCFAGDVGSVTMAFILIFLLATLVVKTQNFIYLSFFLLYGFDVVSTLFLRLMRGENILQPHRKHFYQFLVNEKKLSHLSVALTYAFFQLFLNSTIITFFEIQGSYRSSCNQLFWIIGICSTLFVIVRFLLQGKPIRSESKISPE